MEEILGLNLDLKTKHQIEALVEIGSLDPKITVDSFLNLKGGLRKTAIYRQIRENVENLSN